MGAEWQGNSCSTAPELRTVMNLVRGTVLQARACSPFQTPSSSWFNSVELANNLESTFVLSLDEHSVIAGTTKIRNPAVDSDVQ
jgi:hypothetical protein